MDVGIADDADICGRCHQPLDAAPPEAAAAAGAGRARQLGACPSGSGHPDAAATAHCRGNGCGSILHGGESSSGARSSPSFRECQWFTFSNGRIVSYSGDTTRATDTLGSTDKHNWVSDDPSRSKTQPSVPICDRRA